MMKSIHKILSLGFVLALLALVGCEEERIIFKEANFVRFSDTTLVFKESIGELVPIEVHVVGKALNQAVTVNYSIGGSAREGRDYVIEGTKGTITIPAGEYFGTIMVRIINNANNILNSQDVLFTLTGVSASNELVLGQNGGNLGKTLRLTIQDDCLLSGFYTGTRRGSPASVPDIEINSIDCKTYTVANWNIGLRNVLFNLTAVKPTVQFIDKGDNTLTIPKQVTPELPTPYDTLSGNGIFNPQTKAITLNINIKLPLSASRDTIISVPFTYTPRK